MKRRRLNGSGAVEHLPQIFGQKPSVACFGTDHDDSQTVGVPQSVRRVDDDVDGVEVGSGDSDDTDVARQGDCRRDRRNAISCCRILTEDQAFDVLVGSDDPRVDCNCRIGNDIRRDLERSPVSQSRLCNSDGDES